MAWGPNLFAGLVEDDLVVMHVEALGAFSHDTQIGHNTTVPLLRANIIMAFGFDG